MAAPMGSGRMPVKGWSYINQYGQKSRGSQGRNASGGYDWNYDDPRNINPYGRQYIP